MSSLSGVGLGWRPETAWCVQRRIGLGFTEVIAESLDPARLPPALTYLRGVGLPVVAHGISLSLGGADPLDMSRVDHLARVAEALGSPLVSEHVSFVRAGGNAIGHLTPIPRTEASLEVLIANVEQAQKVLPVPLALENIAGLFEWPDNAMSEAEFLNALSRETDCGLLLDLANLHANAQNHGWDVEGFLDMIDRSRIAYAHVAGGIERRGRYYDTHAHPVSDPSLGLLGRLAAGGCCPPTLLERDAAFPGPGRLGEELDRIEHVLQTAAPDRGRQRAASSA